MAHHLVITGAAAATTIPPVSNALGTVRERVWESLANYIPGLRDHPNVYALLALGVGLAGFKAYFESMRRKAIFRASQLKSVINVVKQHPSEMIASLLGKIFDHSDTADTIR